MSSKYSIYTGRFPCHTCGEVVTSLRLYPDTRLSTWMCQQKHLSQVDFNYRKTKKDYEQNSA